MNNLEFFRRKMGLTQNEMGQKLGVTKQYYWRLESGRQRIHPKYIEKIKSIFSLSESEAFTLTGNARPTEASETQKYITMLEQHIALLEKHVALLEKTAGMKS